MTALPSLFGRDRRQFRLLSNDAVRRLLNTALSSRDADPVQFALWMVALVGTPPTFYAFNQTRAYASLRRAPAAVVERVATGDRLFFVISIAQPSSPLLSLPLVFTFFAIFGLGAAMATPTDLAAATRPRPTSTVQGPPAGRTLRTGPFVSRCPRSPCR